MKFVNTKPMSMTDQNNVDDILKTNFFFFLEFADYTINFVTIINPSPVP